MFRKIVILFSASLLIVIFGVAFVFFWGFYLPKDATSEEVIFLIEKGEGMSQIAMNLEQQELINSSYFFIIYGKITEKGRVLKPGSYKISAKMPVSQIIEMFVKGAEDRLLIIEGWNLRDIADFLEDNNYGTKEEFYALVGTPPTYIDGRVVAGMSGENNFKEEFDFLKEVPENLSLEGYLFPDTYFISPGTSMESIIRSVLSNFKQKINSLVKEELENSSMSLFEVITKASLIEKEVVLYEDKQLVAGIINNRLKKNMRLQIDATITYLTQKRSVQIPITETRINSPYNTYVNHGLPLGPICNPGIESIRAVLNPKESDYLYYLSKPTGETVFSRTHEEHVKAKNEYLR